MRYPLYTDPEKMGDVLATAFKSSFSDSGGCVEVGMCHRCPEVHFYDSKGHGNIGNLTPIFTIKAAKWEELIAETQRRHAETGQFGVLNPVDWFCSVVSRFNEQEIRAFELGVLDDQFGLERLRERLGERLRATVRQPELVAV